uniref:Uncharacterized protein n=1 Tax=Clytia hemisphaerica TaxID=252671 RepID=A0A7M5V472_9CNID
MESIKGDSQSIEDEEMVILPTLKKSITRSKILQKKKREYSESFAIHGLSRVFHGTKLEQIFWLINLLLSLGVAIFLIRKQVESYFNKETFMDENKVIDNEVGFPTITLCTNEDRSKLLYCKRPVAKYTALNNNDGNPCQENGEAKNEVLLHKFTFEFAVFGHLFELRCKGDCDAMTELLLWRPVANFTNCVQFNGPINKNTEITKDYISYSFKPRVEIKNLEIFIHEHERRGGVRLSHLQDTDIRIRKTVKTKRLEAPYPSRCITEEEGSQLNIFPGAYSTQACAESVRCVESFKACGDTFDFCSKYIPQIIKEKHQKRNRTVLTIKQCLRKYTKYNQPVICRQPCHQVSHDVQIITRPFSKNRDEWQNHFGLDLILVQPGSYIQQQEKALFTLEDLLGIVGGTIGLFCGFSIMSLFELMIYVGIKVIHKRPTVGEDKEKENDHATRE